MTTLAEQAVDALTKVYGEHPGERAVHAKGVVCRGLFAATPEAARLTVAAHMQGEPVDATVRFSNASGNPHAKDRTRDARGMGTKFYLPDGTRTDIVAVTLPAFIVRTPEDFLELTRARAAHGLARAWKLLAFIVRHPESLRGLRAAARMRPPSSYASCHYNALHAFRWVAADGRKRHVRYRWVPEVAEGEPSDDLRQELADRLREGPVRFTLEVDLAAAGARVDDPTSVWKPRRTITAGTLEITGFEEERDTGGDLLVFDPTRVTEGIELSDDPVLRFRPHAYDVSARRRGELPAPAEEPASR